MNVFWRNISFVFVIITAAISGGCGEDLTIHAPSEKTFFLPTDDEPLTVLLSFPDTWEPSSVVMMMALLDEDGVIVRRQGTIPIDAPVTIEPGSIAGQARKFNIPAGSTPGWHTIRAWGIRRLDDGTNEVIQGDSERFFVSQIDTDEGDAGMDVLVGDNGPPTVVAGGAIHTFPLEWADEPFAIAPGFDCSGPDTDRRAMLFKGGSHGISHQHWQLEGEMGSTEVFTIPADVPPGTDYFLWLSKGPLCNGTSRIFPIVGP